MYRSPLPKENWDLTLNLEEHRLTQFIELELKREADSLPKYHVEKLLNECIKGI